MKHLPTLLESTFSDTAGTVLGIAVKYFRTDCKNGKSYK
jgi:hypothetical protein